MKTFYSPLNKNYNKIYLITFMPYFEETRSLDEIVILFSK